MKDVLFIYPPYSKRKGGGTLFPLGVGYLISSIKENEMTYDYIDAQTVYEQGRDSFVNELASIVQKDFYKLIALSCITTAAIPFLSDIVEACRIGGRDTPIVMGGPLLSIDYVAELFLNEFSVDGVCIGAGEHVLPALVNHLKRGYSVDTYKYIATYDRKTAINTLSDINELAFPYRSRKIIEETRLSFSRSTYAEKSITMIASRGCFYRCRYCVSGCTSSHHFQKRSWCNVVSEIIDVQRQFGVYSIVFYDDCFFHNVQTVNKDIDDFLGEVRKQGCESFKWQFEIRADVARAISAESWKRLYASGCSQINVGVESCYDNVLKYLGKGIKVSTIEEALERRYIYAPKIIAKATFILCEMCSDTEHIMGIIEFAKRMHLMYIRIYPLELHPGTVLYESRYGKSDYWYRYITSKNSHDSCLYFTQDDSELERIFSDIQDAYHAFYLSDYWKASAKEHYGQAFESVMRGVVDTFNLGANK